MPNTKPLVTAALICEKVIVENDGVPTIIRVIDKHAFFAPQGLKVDADLAAVIKVTAFFAVKAGDLRGEQEFSLSVRKASGERVSIPSTWKVVFDREEGGGNLILSLHVPAEEGVNYVDLFWKDELLATSPFRLERGAAPDSTREK